MSLFHMLTTGSFSACFFSNKPRVVSAAVPNLLTVSTVIELILGSQEQLKDNLMLSLCFLSSLFLRGEGRRGGAESSWCC